MRPSRIVRSIVTALAASSAACSREPPLERVAAEVSRPGENDGVHARLLVRHHPRSKATSSHGLPGASFAAQGRYVLELKRSSTKSLYLLESFNDGSGIGEGTKLSASGYRQAIGRELMLSGAPDGHALALSKDEGKTWTYIGIDAGRTPLFCKHETFAVGGKAPWPAMPGTRDVVLRVLSNPRAHSVAWNDYAVGASLKFLDDEIGPAATFACRNLDDERMRDALATSIVQGPFPFDVENDGACIQELARTRPRSIDDWRAALKDVKTVVDTDTGPAQALSWIASPSIQDALAEAVGRGEAAYPRKQHAMNSCETWKNLAWALMRSVVVQGAATPRTIDVLTEIASNRGCETRKIGAIALAAVGGEKSVDILTAMSTEKRCTAEPSTRCGELGGKAAILKQVRECPTPNRLNCSDGCPLECLAPALMRP